MNDSLPWSEDPDPLRAGPVGSNRPEGWPVPSRQRQMALAPSLQSTRSLGQPGLGRGEGHTLIAPSSACLPPQPCSVAMPCQDTRF